MLPGAALTLRPNRSSSFGGGSRFRTTRFSTCSRFEPSPSSSPVFAPACSLSAACAEGRFNEAETRQVRSFAARVDALAGEMGHLKELMKKQEEAIKLIYINSKDTSDRR